MLNKNGVIEETGLALGRQRASVKRGIDRSGNAGDSVNSDSKKADVHPYRSWLYRAEVAACVLSAALFVMTLVDPMWIERWFEQSPDGGDGSTERWIVGGSFFIAAVLAAALARRERRRFGAAIAVR